MAYCLITGGAGFIGSALARRCITAGHQVLIVDNLSTGFKENIPLKAVFMQGDIQNAELIKQLEKEYFDIIFHIAGQSSGEVSFEDPAYDLQTNVQSTVLLLDLARKIHCQNFVYASSVSVYGNQSNSPLTESAFTEPCSFYGVGKLASERYMKIYTENYGINTTALRLFNVYGPGQNLYNMKQGMISIYLAQALQNGYVQVKGSLERFRDFVYIDDVVEAFCACLNHNLLGFNIFNIGSGIKVRVWELLENIQEKLKSSLNYEILEGTPGDVFGSYANIKHAENFLNWKPSVSLDTGLEKMIEWSRQDARFGSIIR